MKLWFAVLVISALLLGAGSPASELYFPDERWETVDPIAARWDPDKLAAAIEFAMSRKSSGVVVLYRGRILAEAYQPLKPQSLRYRGMVHGQDSDGRVIEDVASVQKSVVSFLVGVAKEKGLVEIRDPIQKHLGVGWSRANFAQESAITLQHAITMTTGLDERLNFVTRPEKQWRYNTTAYSQSLQAISAASAKSPNELTRQWLTDRIGMKDSRWVERPWADESAVAANRVGLATTARDLARFGLLILADGKWKDEVLLGDQAYLRASMTPSQTLNPSYGYLWWLNGESFSIRGNRRIDGPLISTAPDDLVAALGALGRKCYVVPSMELVVTRLGDTPEKVGKPQFDVEFWRLLREAAAN